MCIHWLAYIGNSTMAILNCHTIRPQIVASSALPNESSSSLPQLKPSKPATGKPYYKKLKKKKKQQQQQPSVMEIERAIGAGIFRDRDVNSEAEEKTTSLFDNIMRNTVGKNEGSLEKQLRETGEWLIHLTHRTSRSAGKQILKSMFVWMIPLWMFAFLVASGAVHLPFHAPLLDDLLS